MPLVVVVVFAVVVDVAVVIALGASGPPCGAAGDRGESFTTTVGISAHNKHTFKTHNVKHYAFVCHSCFVGYLSVYSGKEILKKLRSNG